MKRHTKTLTIPIEQAFKQRKWYSSITIKVALLAWGLIISSIIIIGIYNFATQEKIILERMKIEASNISESIIQAHATSLFTENYDVVIDFCNKLLGSSSSIEFITLSKKDGNSLIFKKDPVTKKDSWSFEILNGSWIKPNEIDNGTIAYSDILRAESFRYSKQFVYTGVIWGHVHLGISLDSYRQAMRDLIWRTVIFSVSFVILSFFIAVLFSRRLTKPIKDLVHTSREIEAGDLKARAEILSNDELGFLAHSFNSMAASISKSNESLEATVRERTLELGITNKKLVEEVNEKEKAQIVLHQYAVKLETLEEIYKGIINAETTNEVFYNTIENIHKKLIKFTIAALSLYDSENSIVNLSAFSYRKGEFVKTDAEFPLDNYSGTSKLGGQEYYLQNALSAVKNKTQMENFISTEGRESYISFPLHYQSDIIGELTFGFDEYFIIEDEKLNTLVEISHHVSVAVMQLYLEEKLRLHADQMKQSLEEKETLLKEIHHRVKNNLQVISSLLYLQSRNIKDESSLAIFRDSQMRVRSLALVHEKLYQSNNLSKIDFAEYVKNLVTHIKNSYKITSEEIEIILELDKLYLSVDKAVPIGLLLNELLSNAFKYAFPETQTANNKQKYILIKLTAIEDEKILLMVSDNGVGIPESHNIETSNSLGLKIVANLVSQIDGKLNIKNRDNTEFSVVFTNE